MSNFSYRNDKVETFLLQLPLINLLVSEKYKRKGALFHVIERQHFQFMLYIYIHTYVVYRSFHEGPKVKIIRVISFPFLFFLRACKTANPRQAKEDTRDDWT